MPEVLQVTLLEHHNAGYRGDYDILVHLVQLADFLYLNRNELPEPSRLPTASLALLQVLPERVLDTAAQVFSAQDEFTALSKLLAGTS